MRKIKRPLFIAATLLLAITSVQQLSAQQKERTLPKHEFTINGFGGVSTLDYSVDGLDFSKGYSGGFGLGYHWFFAKRWGLVTGLEAAQYKASLEAASLRSGQYVFHEAVPGRKEEYIMRYDLSKFKEKQRAWMLQIPVMVQWMQPLGRSANTHFYTALGGRLGITVDDEFRQSAAGVDYAAIGENEILTPALITTTAIGGFDSKGALKLATLNAMASAEVGFRWRLGAATSLYTGVYVDYGFIDILPSASGEAVHMPVSAPNTHPLQPTGYNHNSILTSHRPDYGELHEPQPGWNPVPRFVEDSERYTDKVNTFAAGLKIKIAFGKRKAQAPVYVAPIPEPVVVPEPVVEEPPVVVPEPVIEEPVQEVPQEIKQSMMRLSNTLFAFDKWNLSDEAIVELDKVTAWLRENPAIHVEIEGHTDNKGSQAYNQRLSEERAKSVHDYFVSHGVSASRLSYRGYGLTDPVADNATAEGRQQNRRVELKIVADE